MASPLDRRKHVRPVAHCPSLSHSPVQARRFLALASLPPESSFIAGGGAGVGACVVGAGVGVGVGADVGACVVGAGVGACVVGAGVGACVVGAGVGDFVVGDSVGDCDGDCVVGAFVVGDSVGDCVGDCVVGAFVVGDSVGDCVGDCVVGDSVGGDSVGDCDGDFFFFTFGILWGQGIQPMSCCVPWGHGQGSGRGEYSVSHAGSSRLQTTDLARSCRTIWKSFTESQSLAPPSPL